MAQSNPRPGADRPAGGPAEAANDTRADTIAVDRAQLRALLESYDTTLLESRVNEALKRRYAVFGTLLAAIALFGGYTILSNSIEGMIDTPVAAKLQQADDKLDELDDARTKASAGLASLDLAVREVADVVGEARQLKANIQEQAATQQADLEKIRQESSEALEKARSTNETLPRIGEALQATRRDLIREVALARLAAERNAAMTKLFADVVAAVGNASASPDVVDSTEAATTRADELLKTFAQREADIRRQLDMNVVLYGIAETEELRRIKANLEDDAFLPEVWITPGQMARDGAAAEIAAEFGIDPKLLAQYDGAIVYSDDPATKRVVEALSERIKTVASTAFALLPLPLDPVAKHRTVFGRTYPPNNIVLVSMLPPSGASLVANP